LRKKECNYTLFILFLD